MKSATMNLAIFSVLMSTISYRDGKKLIYGQIK